MRESDAEYFARRAVEEEQAAASAVDWDAAEIHRKLARKYASMAEQERARRGSPAQSVRVFPSHYQ